MMSATARSSAAGQDGPVALAMRHITKTFPGVRALSDVSLTVRAGEVHAILGENGAGKSTLMNVLAGVFTDYDGTIEVAGEPASIHHPRDAQRLGIAMIHQELNLVPGLSIADNIFLGRELRTARGTIDRPAMNARTRELLGALGIELDPRRLIGQCRVAEQQLVEVAKALNLNVRIFVMDEPTSALADAEVQRLFTVIRQLVSGGVAVVFISHRLEELYEIADNVTVLRDGGLVGTRPVKDISREDLIQMMVGRPFSEFTARGERADSSAGPPSEKQADRLSVTGLHVDRGNRPPLRGVSFSVRPGEIVGLAGLMGAGRTEVLEAIYGTYTRSAVRGTFLLDGKPYRPRSPARAIRRGLAFVAEDRKTQSLMLEASVRFNASLAALRSFVRGGVVRGRQERAAVEAKVRELRVRTPSLNAVVNNLSGGNQQKVVLTRCLLTRPSLLLMDEPTRGVDVGAKTEIYQLMNKLAADGCGILMVSSELPELLALCDRILVLCEGRLTGEFRGSQATQEEILSAAMAREIVVGKAPSDEDHQPSEV